MIIDTHAHLYLEEYAEDLAQVINRAKNNRVKKVLLPNIDISTIQSQRNIVAENSDFFYPMMGLHPTSVKEDYREQLDFIYNELNRNSDYIAIGEIGIDLYWDKSFFKEQVEAFETQVRWSIEKKIPLSIHSRNSYNEIVKSLRKFENKSIKGVFHSFSGDIHDLQELLKFENFYIGINGIITFKNSDLKEVLKKCPMDKILIETDSPYLTPTPFRGKRNEPSNLKYIIQTISQIYKLDPHEVEHITKKNAQHLFNINL